MGAVLLMEETKGFIQARLCSHQVMAPATHWEILSMGFTTEQFLSLLKVASSWALDTMALASLCLLDFG